jgi:hypothetical protein
MPRRLWVLPCCSVLTAVPGSTECCRTWLLDEPTTMLCSPVGLKRPRRRVLELELSHTTTAPPAKWARWSGTAGHPGRRSSTGWCLCGTMACFFPRAPAFSGQMDRLSMKPELATRHDPQTTHRPKKFASNPTPVTSNATPCTHRAS